MNQPPVYLAQYATQTAIVQQRTTMMYAEPDWQSIWLARVIIKMELRNL